MPLASWFSLHWYREAAMASRDAVGAGSVQATAKGQARMNDVVQGVGSVSLAKPTRLRNSPMVTTGVGSCPLALPKARARPAMVARVGVLSQDDVTGAVLEAKVEGGYSVKQVLALLAAFAAGKTDITDLGSGNATVVFRNVTDTGNKITASVTGSERTNVTIT